MYLDKGSSISLHETDLQQAGPCLPLPLLLLPSPSDVERAALAQDKLAFHWRRECLLRWLKILQYLNTIILILDY